MDVGNSCMYRKREGSVNVSEVWGVGAVMTSPGM